MASTIIPLRTRQSTTVSAERDRIAVRPMAEGEVLHMNERIVVSPATGVFEPVAPALRVGDSVTPGQLIGHIVSGSVRVAISSHFGGNAQEVRAWRNERVRQFQPVLWIRTGAS